MKILASVLLSCVAVHALHAQEEIKESRLELTSMSINFGVFTAQEGFSNSQEEFNKLAPSSILLNQDISKYNQDDYGYYTSNAGPSFNAQAYFNLKKKDGGLSKFNPQLRFGLTYAGNTMISRYYSHSEYFRVDTLISNQNGQAYYVDSVETESYDMEYSREQLYIDGAFLMSSNPKSRLKIYGGIGVSVGLSFNSRTTVRYYKDNYIDNGVPNGNNYSYPYGDDSQEEVFLNDEGLMAMLSIPFGLELKLSMKENGWSKCRLFFEGRPSLSYASVPELGSTITSAGIWGTGFKYDF